MHCGTQPWCTYGSYAHSPHKTCTQRQPSCKKYRRPVNQEAPPWSFQEEKYPEVETRKVDTGLGARTIGGEGGKEFWRDTLLFCKRQVNSSPNVKNCQKEGRGLPVFLDNSTRKKWGNLERINYESRVLPECSSSSTGNATHRVRNSTSLHLMNVKKLLISSSVLRLGWVKILPRDELTKTSFLKLSFQQLPSSGEWIYILGTVTLLQETMLDHVRESAKRWISERS